ncbi:unnamed protein product, partial [Callosobruchus maculatus]
WCPDSCPDLNGFNI